MSEPLPLASEGEEHDGRFPAYHIASSDEEVIGWLVDEPVALRLAALVTALKEITLIVPRWQQDQEELNRARRLAFSE